MITPTPSTLLCSYVILPRSSAGSVSNVRFTTIPCTTARPRRAPSRRPPVILLEGLLILEDRALRELLDLKIYVDTDADVRILRRIVRDVKKRARTLESVVTQYLTTVKPMHEAFIEPSKKYADIIIPEGGKNPVAYGMIIDRIDKQLKNHAAAECDRV